jgi:site-specific recombinase
MHYAKYYLAPLTTPSTTTLTYHSSVVEPGTKQFAVIWYIWLYIMGLKRVLSVEFVELSPEIPRKLSKLLHTSF